MTAAGDQPRPDPRSATRLLARTARHGGAWMIVLTLNIAVLAVAESALPAVVGRAIDAALGRTAPAHWLLWSAVVVAVLVVSDVADEVGTASVTARSTSWLRRTALRHLVSVRLRSLDRFSSGELVSRLVGNTAGAGSAGPDGVGVVTSLALASAGVIALFIIDPWLALTFLVGMPVLLGMFWAFAKDMGELTERYLETQGVIASRLVSALIGARTIAAAGTTRRETERVLEPLPELHRHGRGVWRAQTRITSQDTVLFALIEIAVLAVAGVELSRGRISPGELFAASQYVALASTAGAAISSLTGLIRERAAVARVDEILRLPAVRYGAMPLPAGTGLLELRHVSVLAADRVLLDDIDLVVDGGALVAVVGRSGAGKSQLAAVAGRLIDPDRGEVLLDGTLLRDLDRLSLRRAVGYGFERPALIGNTLAASIGFGSHDPLPVDVTTAARAAHADGFIRRMPEGYDTPLGDAPMSGGEVQRIGLARAFAHAERVLILDDVAASLDTVTEHEIAKTITGPMSDRTRILVAHRASTAARADVVVWLEGGRVRRVASHQELWQDANYRALFDQTDESSEAPPEVDSAAALIGEPA